MSETGATSRWRVPWGTGTYVLTDARGLAKLVVTREPSGELLVEDAAVAGRPVGKSGDRVIHAKVSEVRPLAE